MFESISQAVIIPVIGSPFFPLAVINNAPTLWFGPVIPVKCREVFFLASQNTTGFTIVAGLTNVTEFPLMTGSNGFEGIG